MAEPRQGVEFLSLPCGRLFGVPIRLHVLLPLAPVMAALATVMAGHPWYSVLLAALIAGPLLLLTVLVHELGHVLAARRCGCSADHILLWPLGGLAFIGGAVQPKEQIFISGSGPATHLPMMGLWAVLLAFLHGGITLSTHEMYVETHFGSLVCIAMLNTNLAMLLFNLLVPCFPLDCSRILASLLLVKGMEPGKAAKVIVICSVVALLGVVLVSVFAFMGTHSSASMNFVLVLWLAFQTYRLNQARLTGQLATDPLFSSVMQQPSSGSTRSFQTFQEGPTSVGKPQAPSGQVCLATLIALSIALSVSQVNAN